MKNILIAIMVLTAVMCMGGKVCIAEGSYMKYESRFPELGVSVEYPAGWQNSETFGTKKAYAQLMFYEAKAEGADRGGAIVLTAYLNPEGIKPANIAAVADGIVQKRSRLGKAGLAGRSSGELLGMPTVDLALFYEMPKAFDTADNKMIPIRSRDIIFERNGCFWVLRYENTAEKFDASMPAFEHFLKTLTFQ
jgi:hypothetical protein